MADLNDLESLGIPTKEYGKEKQVFDFKSFFKDNGMTFMGKSENGNPIVQGSDGSEQEFDAKAFLQDNGLNPLHVIPEYNSPSEAMSTSPLNEIDRAKLSVGNDKGKLSYLKKNFDGAKLDEKMGLVVLKDGAWHQVDGSGFGQYFNDPWELSKDLADLGDIAANVYATTKGAALGGAAGTPLGPAGIIAGGLAGAGAGGLAAGTVRTSLGRAVGTYEADVAEQTIDIGLEGLFSLGGQVLSLGMKPTLGMARNALTKIASKTNDAGKSVIATVYGQLTGAGDDVIRTVIDEPVAYTARAKMLAKGAQNAEDIVVNATESAVAKTEELLKLGTEALPKKYASLMEELIQSPNISKLKIDTTELLAGPAKVIEEKGFGKLVKQGSNVIFKPFSKQEQMLRQAQNLPVENVPANAIKDIQNIVSELSEHVGQKFDKAGAARVLVGINKTLNQLVKDSTAINTTVSPVGQRAVTEVGAAYRNSVTETFNKAGLATEYKTLQDVYKQYGDVVQYARKALDSGNPEAMDQVFKRITGDATKSRGTKRTLGIISDLVGEKGAALMNDIALDNAVAKTSRWMPKLGLANTAAGVSLTARAAAVPIIAATAAAASPKMAAKQLAVASRVATGTKAARSAVVDYGFKTLDEMRKLSPTAMNELLRSPELLKAFHQAPIDAMNGEADETESVYKLIQEKLGQ